MHDRTARVFSGLGVLVLVWIGVYWIWTPRDDDSAIPGVSLTEPKDFEPVPGRDGRNDEGLERFPRFGEGDPSRFGIPEANASRSPDEPADAVPSNETPERASQTGGVIPPAFDDYTVVSGDNFERISQKVYGSRRHAMAIARSNPLLDPRKLRAGDTIRVPRDPANIQGIPVDEDGDAEDRPVPESAPQTIEYTVKRGDTLSGIAKAFYGSIRHVDFLYNANRGRMASKDDLRLGQVLLVPPLPEGAD